MSATLTALLQPRITAAMKSSSAKSAALAADQSLASAELIQQQFVLELSRAIASAVQEYLLTNVKVKPTSLTVNPNIPVAVTTTTGVGATSAPGTGTTAVGDLVAP